MLEGRAGLPRFRWAPGDYGVPTHFSSWETSVTRTSLCHRGRGTAIVLVAALSWCASILGSVGHGAAAATPAVEHWGSFVTGAGSRQDTVSVPTALGLPAPVVQAATSNAANYALLADGEVDAWGLGQEGELGDGRTVDSPTTPVRVEFPPGVSIARLADTSPYDTALAVDTSGNAWGWGLDSYGQLCQGTRTKELVPVRVPLVHVSSLAGAGDHALYVRGGKVWACGGNGHGDLGDASTTPSAVPVAVTGISGTVTSVYASWRNSGALVSGGTYDSWGFNDLGNVGDGEPGVDALMPQQIALPAPVRHAALGGSGSNNGQTLVLLSNQRLMAWGCDSDGQLGDGSTRVEASPITVAPDTNVVYAQVATGGATSYAVDTATNLWAWGRNRGGELGDGSTRTSLAPIEVASGVTRISTTADDVVAW